jgi:hypothetical protein
MKIIRYILYTLIGVVAAFILFILGAYIYIRIDYEANTKTEIDADVISYALAHTVEDVQLPDINAKERAVVKAKLLGTDVPFITISDDERYILECVVAGEAGGHSYELMKAVAQCMAVSMDIEGMTADELRVVHGYYGWNPGLEQTDPAAWSLVKSAVSEIFDDGNFVTYSLIQYFYNPEHGGGDFHESMHYVMTIDGCRFFSKVVM